MAKYKNAEATGIVISHWLSTRYALDYLGIFERLNNPNFNVTEFGNGLILCTEGSEEQIKYLEMDKTGIRVAHYYTELPKPEELQEIIQHQIQLTKQKQAMIEK